MTGLEPDRAVLERRLLHLSDSVRLLESFRDVSLDDLRSDAIGVWGLERGLQTSIQAILDIAGHLVAASGQTVSDDYRSGLLRLAEIGVLPASFAERIAPMAGLRNILVHEYLEVDVAILKTVLTNNLDDFREFAWYIEDYLEQQSR